MLDAMLDVRVDGAVEGGVVRGLSSTASGVRVAGDKEEAAEARARARAGGWLERIGA